MYELELDWARAADGLGDPPKGRSSHEDRLREMQRNWLAYRDATCQYEKASRLIRPSEFHDRRQRDMGRCLLEMTAHQALYYGSWLHG